ncbi:hypothetical protein A2U01_0002586, partial [Trifolium medium]|nr:hypothetical protein [Trifolium medium]
SFTAIGPPLLSGPNYHTWSRAMKVAPMAKNKMCFVDGSLLSPLPSDPLYGAWRR